MRKSKIFIVYVLVLILIMPVLTAAVQGTVSGVPPSGGEGDPPPIVSGEGKQGYLNWLYPILLSAAAILSVLMIVIGGVEYIGAAASGNPENIKNARTKIIDAVLGLLLAFGAWLILNTINPDLVNLRLNIPSIE